jgi:FMN-dependent NADH-azoreductase
VPSGKKVIIASARGGFYSDGPTRTLDYQETYLRTVLEFIGPSDITFVRAEGVGRSLEAHNTAIQLAEAQVASAVQAA